MPELIELDTFSDNRGNLSVLEDYQIPFPIKRMFYIYGVDDSQRGGHRHHKTIQALISIQGRCEIECDDGNIKSKFVLDHPKKCLIVQPEDWHVMNNFADNKTVLLVLASEYYNHEDYILEPYS